MTTTTPTGCHVTATALTFDTVYMLESKAKTKLHDDDVIVKKAAAEKWCRQASEHAQKYGSKPWVYALIPHDAIAQNMTLKGLANQYS